MLRTLAIGGVLTAVTLTGLGLTATHAAAEPAPRFAESRFAQRPLGRLITGQVGRLMTLRSDLNVSSDQKQAIGNVLAAHRESMAGHIQAIVKHKQALSDQVRQDEIDEAAIRAAADDFGKAIGDAAVEMAHIRAEVRPLLTEDQRERLDAFHNDSDKAITRWLEEVADHADPHAD